MGVAHTKNANCRGYSKMQASTPSNAAKADGSKCSSFPYFPTTFPFPFSCFLFPLVFPPHLPLDEKRHSSGQVLRGRNTVLEHKLLPRYLVIIFLGFLKFFILLRNFIVHPVSQSFLSLIKHRF